MSHMPFGLISHPPRPLQNHEEYRALRPLLPRVESKPTSRTSVSSTPILYSQIAHMDEESHSQGYRTNGPMNGPEELLELTEAQQYSGHRYLPINFDERYTHAPPSSVPTSWKSDYVFDHYVEPSSQPNFHPVPAHKILPSQRSSPYEVADVPEASQYGGVYPHDVVPSQRFESYEVADIAEAYHKGTVHARNILPSQRLRTYEVAGVIPDVIPVVQTPQSKSQRGQKLRATTRVAAEVPEGQPRSKRAERRAQILLKYGSVSASDQPRGKTIMNSGVLEWFDPKQSTYHKAAPLDEYRHEIIRDDKARGEYDHAPDKGLHEDDVTTLPVHDPLGQRHWNVKDRNAWADIRDEHGNQVMYLVEKPDRDVEPPVPGFMTYDDMIMLDPDDNPILDWPGLPRCLSSNIEGARIEALRRVYPWISLPHFRARMPRWVARKTAGTQPLFGLSSLQQRLTRFREIYDCPPWKKLHILRGTSLLKHTRERLAREGLQANSTAGLEPLTRKEALRRKKPFLGRCPENAGLYTLTEDEKEEKAAMEAARREEVRAQNHGKATLRGPSTGTKRKRDPTMKSSSSMQPAQKQARSASSTAVHMNRQTSSISISDLSAPDTIADENSIEHEVLLQVADEDLRWVAPRKIAEQVSIQAALTYTVADFKSYHNMDPPVTTATHCYFQQYQQIQDYHQKNWNLKRGRVPHLIYIADWLGSFQMVPLPDVDEEHFRRLFPTLQSSTQADADPEASDKRHLGDIQADTATSNDQHLGDIQADTETSNDQHLGDIQAAADASGEPVSEWHLDTENPYFLDAGGWDCDLGLFELSSPGQAQPDTY